jgi:D-alanyl-D-alanine carboxypeptidase/D-alanyl-D-alanine-endopeptidase (penicillin-binding protein 4)
MRHLHRNFVWVLLLLAFGWAAPGLPSTAAQEPARARKQRLQEERELRRRADRFRARVEAILAGQDASVPRPRAHRRPPQPGEPTLEELRARIPKGRWGVLIADAASGQTLFARDAENYFTPASNTKLYTTALALALLGPHYRFRTTVETYGTVDARGRLLGDLILVGRGDPNLSNRKLPYDPQQEYDGPAEKILELLAEGVVAAGVKQIEGDLVADASWFAAERYPPGWTIDDMTFRYGAPVSALTVHDNALAVEVRPGETAGAPVWFSVEPWADFYEFRNEAVTAAADAEIAEEDELRLVREPGSRVVTLRGRLPLGAEKETLWLAVEEPAAHAAALFRRILEQRGVRVYGRPRVRTEPPHSNPPATVLAEHVSLPLIEAVRVVNKVSQNLHAELLLRTVAKEKTGTGSREAGLALLQEFLETSGIARGEVSPEDGSGLARQNLLTPAATVALLRWVARQPWGEAYRATLPVAGFDGTLRDRMKETAAAGHIFAKTGTLENSNALSGYAETRSGRRLVFAIFGNQHHLPSWAATDVIDAICAAMVEEF